VKLKLPPKTQKLIFRYTNLKLGPHIVACPYYQNVSKRKGKSVYIGKGLPKEIEKEAKALFTKRGKRWKYFEPSSIRLYMVMADLGIDCSGFVARIIESFLKENDLNILSLKPGDSSLVSLFKYKIRPYTNLSADALTGTSNCIKITDINNVRPSDFIRVGGQHLAIVTEVEKTKGLVKKITYYHSTSDYLDKHGVRKGSIVITNLKNSLVKQKWTEYYNGRNWMYEDFKKAGKNDRGLRRLKILQDNLQLNN
jgi:hypothetical protein